MKAVSSEGVKSCGQRKSPSAYIVDGEDINHGDFPWTVALLRKTEAGAEYVGGGTIISSHHVLTGMASDELKYSSYYV